MRTFTASEAKNKLGELIDLARASPVAITRYDRPVVVVMALEEFEWLKELDMPAPASGAKPLETR